MSTYITPIDSLFVSGGFHISNKCHALDDYLCHNALIVYLDLYNLKVLDISVRNLYETAMFQPSAWV